MSYMHYAILQTTFSSTFLAKNILILFKISLKFAPNDLTDNMSALVQVMAWCWTGDKPSPDTMLAHIYIYICQRKMRHPASNKRRVTMSPKTKDDLTGTNLFRFM